MADSLEPQLNPPEESDTPLEISGILPIDKPTGMTSHDVVDVVRRLYGVKRVGHTGTLDPAASGLLLVMVGRATRVAPYLSGQDKTYLAAIEFGATSDSGDSEGTITPTGKEPPTAEMLASVIASFVGEVELDVPAMAAVHSSGRRRYELARRGAEVPKLVRVARIDRIDLLRYRGVGAHGCAPGSQGAESPLSTDHSRAGSAGASPSQEQKGSPRRPSPASRDGGTPRDDEGGASPSQTDVAARPAVPNGSAFVNPDQGQGHTSKQSNKDRHVTPPSGVVPRDDGQAGMPVPLRALAQIRVRCSSGTYIRSLAQAIGEKCGCGAYLAALRREEIGRASVLAAYRLEYLDMLAFRGEPPVPPEPVDDYLGLPTITLKAESWEGIHHGQPLAKRDMLKTDDTVTANATVMLRVEKGEVVAIAESLFDAEGLRSEDLTDDERIVTYRCVLI
jgi:tRNA pseudouridine(55) synthase